MQTTFYDYFFWLLTFIEFIYILGMNKEKVSILWFRQDLRLKDNPALNALAGSGHLLPIYILDDENAGEFKMGGASRYWLHKSLDSLNASLDSKLNFYSGRAEDIFEQLITNYDVQEIFWNRCYEPWRMKRDKKIKDLLKKNQIEAKSFKSDLLWEPWEVLKDDGDPYRVYSAYYKRLLKNTKLIRSPETKKIKSSLIKDKRSVGLDELKLFPDINWYADMDKLWQPGEKGAHKNFKKFLNSGIKNYKEGRDYPKLESVSRLSPHLHFGEISVAEIWHHIRNNFTDKNAGHFLKEIAWREFSYLLLYHFPQLPKKNLQEKFDKFPWKSKNKKQFDAWKKGNTGYPIVDAGMRELWQTGYMHNRVRMIVGSFLVKNLLMHWRHGERWFWDCLLDADLANNSASWQWVAGSGADAAPYFRIFNPILQGERFDKDGDYVKKYCPELKKLPNKYIHKPFEAPMDVLLEADVKLGENYPHPIVNLGESRDAALDAYEEIKGK